MTHHNPHRLYRPTKTEIGLKEAYEEWRSTDIMTNDKATVKALYYKFKTIADVSLAIPEYSLMAKDAHAKMHQGFWILSSLATAKMKPTPFEKGACYYGETKYELFQARMVKPEEVNDEP